MRCKGIYEYQENSMNSFAVNWSFFTTKGDAVGITSPGSGSEVGRDRRHHHPRPRGVGIGRRRRRWQLHHQEENLAATYQRQEQERQLQQRRQRQAYNRKTKRCRDDAIRPLALASTVYYRIQKNNHAAAELDHKQLFFLEDHFIQRRIDRLPSLVKDFYSTSSFKQRHRGHQRRRQDRQDDRPNVNTQQGSDDDSNENENENENGADGRMISEIKNHTNMLRTAELEDRKALAFGWEPSLRTILLGTRGSPSSCPLTLLRAHEETLIRYIYSFLPNPWTKRVKLTIPAFLVGNNQYGHFDNVLERGRAGRSRLVRFNRGRNRNAWRYREYFSTMESIHYNEEDEDDNDDNDDVATIATTSTLTTMSASTSSTGFDHGYVAFSTVGFVKFPKPANRNVHMMPFIFGNKESLPRSLRCYYRLIEACPYSEVTERGKVGYLTVYEDYIVEGWPIRLRGRRHDDVIADLTRRRRKSGLHIEAPEHQDCSHPSEYNIDVSDDGNHSCATAASAATSSFTPAPENLDSHWGSGVFYDNDLYEGGIYMASSLDNSIKVWDALIDKNRLVPDCGRAAPSSCVEHLRHMVGQGTKASAGELIWMTDSTPHEVLEPPVCQDQQQPDQRRCRRRSSRLLRPTRYGYYHQYFRVVTPDVVSQWHADISTPNPNVPLPENVEVVVLNSTDIPQQEIDDIDGKGTNVNDAARGDRNLTRKESTANDVSSDDKGRDDQQRQQSPNTLTMTTTTTTTRTLSDSGFKSSTSSSTPFSSSSFPSMGDALRTFCVSSSSGCCNFFLVFLQMKKKEETR